MVGISTCRKPNGLVIHGGWKNAQDRPIDCIASIWIDEEECKHLEKAIKEARKKFWDKGEKKI